MHPRVVSGTSTPSMGTQMEPRQRTPEPTRGFAHCSFLGPDAVAWADTRHKTPELGRYATLRDMHFGEIVHIAGNNRLTVALLTWGLSEPHDLEHAPEQNTYSAEPQRGGLSAYIYDRLLKEAWATPSGHCSSDPRFLHSLQH